MLTDELLDHSLLLHKNNIYTDRAAYGPSAHTFPKHANKALVVRVSDTSNESAK